MDMGHFTGNVAVVTGAASGIGRGICEALCAQGAVVYATDVEAEALETLVPATRGDGELRAVVLDVTKEPDVAALIRNVRDEHGRLDLMINNAGVGLVGDFRLLDLDDMRRTTDVNLWGVVYGTRSAYEVMVAQGHGYILNVASAAGLLAPPAMSASNVTKAGVVSLSESLYAEYKSLGIRVAVLCPTFFKTNIVGSSRGATTEKDDAQITRWMERSKVQAPDVAKAAIDSVRDGKLYVQPMRDGRIAWRLKRTHPQRFYDSLSRAHEKYRRNRGKS